MRFFKFLLFVGIIAGVGYYYFNHQESKSISIDGRNINSVNSNSQTARFEIKQPVNMEVFAIGEHSNNLKSAFGPAVKSTFPCLNRQQYYEYKNMVASKICPASYLNSNVDTLTVLTNNSEVGKALATIKDNDHIVINGYKADFTGLFDKDQQNTNLSFSGKPINFVFAESVVINQKKFE